MDKFAKLNKVNERKNSDKDNIKFSSAFHKYKPIKSIIIKYYIVTLERCQFGSVKLDVILLGGCLEVASKRGCICIQVRACVSLHACA